VVAEAVHFEWFPFNETDASATGLPSESRTVPCIDAAAAGAFTWPTRGRRDNKTNAGTMQQFCRTHLILCWFKAAMEKDGGTEWPNETPAPCRGF
jgi:hypothetical protein